MYAGIMHRAINGFIYLKATGRTAGNISGNKQYVNVVYACMSLKVKAQTESHNLTKFRLRWTQPEPFSHEVMIRDNASKFGVILLAKTDIHATLRDSRGDLFNR
jgi:hypothetical protein